MAEQKPPEPEPKPKIIENVTIDGFAVMFASLTIILLAFFVLLNSIATIDERRQRTALGSLIGSFGILPGGFATEKGAKLVPPQKPFMDVDPKAKINIVSILLQYNKKMKKKYAKAGLKSGTGEGFGEGGKQKGFQIEMRGDMVAFTFYDQLLFGKGTSDLTPEALLYMSTTADLIRQLNRRIRIEGHSDDQCPSEGLSSTWGVSSLRAMKVMRALEENGVPVDYMTAVGLGDTKPLVPNTSEETRSKNRRVTVILTHGIKDSVSFTDKSDRINFKNFIFKVKEIF